MKNLKIFFTNGIIRGLLKYKLTGKKCFLAFIICAGMQLLCVTPGIAQVIDFTVLDPWRDGKNQKWSNAVPTEKTSPSKEAKLRQPTESEIRKANEQAARAIAEIRKNLIKPNTLLRGVIWNKTFVQTVESHRYFDAPPSGAGKFAAVASSTNKMPATSVPPIAMRRAAAILARAQQSNGEDGVFLAEQASIVIQGGVSQVFVDDNALGISDRQEKQFSVLLQETEKNYQEIVFAKKEKDRIQKEEIEIKVKLSEGKMNNDEAKLKLIELTKQQLDAFSRSEKAEEKIKNLPKEIEYILVGGK